jgi:acetylornithine/N-succinyldiaminopimelate aminotransferase
MQTYARYPVAIERGQGAIVYDLDGKEYVDFASGIGVNAIGYSNPKWIEAIEAQIRKLGHMSNLFYTLPGTQLAEKLCTLSGMKNVFFANSGAESNEGAIKLARKYSFDKYGRGRSTILTLVNSFHGRTVTTLAATGQEKFHNYFFEFTEGFRYIPANDIAALQGAVSPDVCAVMFEAVQGEGGVLPLEPEYVRAIGQICRENDWLILCDEVQTGMGRTGTLFAFEQFGIRPNVVTTAKGIAGGLPLGAVLADEKCAGVLTPGTHATTFGANPVCCAAALATIGEIEKALPEVAAKGKTIRSAIEGMGSPYVKGTRGMGLMIGVPVEGIAPAELNRRFIEAGLLCLTAGSDAIRILPPLTITYGEIDRGLEIMRSVLCD